MPCPGRALSVTAGNPAAGGAYLAGHTPRLLELHRGTQAYFTIAKYRCDVGASAVPDRIEVSPPAATGAAAVAPRNLPERWLEFCRPFKGPASSDPGNTIDVSPITVVPADR